MSSVAVSPQARPPAVPSVRLLTAADLPFFPRSLPSGDADYELVDGVLRIMAPPGDIHGAAQLKIGAELLIQGERRGFGKARTEVAVVLRRNPDRVVGPDAVFVASKSLPVRLSPEGYLETIPELVVEVRSKNDSAPELEAKVREYLSAGVELVWVADPDAGTVAAHRPNQPAHLYGPADTLPADPIIPGFAVPVADLFR
jgi:Uma2 family endonuclease